MNATTYALASLLTLSACTAPAPSPESAAAATPAKVQAPVAAAPVAVPAEITEARGVDLSRLTAPQRTSFFQIVNVEASACAKPHSLAVSLRDDAACRDSLTVARYIANALASGAAAEDVKRSVEPLVDTLRPRAIDSEGRPSYGNPRAPVTVVVFADFECAHCREEAPVLRQVIDRSNNTARLVYKHFPLAGNRRSRPAALATLAAMEQGKFWEMHDIVFANQGALEDADLRGYARKIGLDMARFDAAYKARKGAELIEADRAEGDKLGITGTPAVYVDGRRMHASLFGGTLAGWIEDALLR